MLQPTRTGSVSGLSSVLVTSWPAGIRSLKAALFWASSLVLWPAVSEFLIFSGWLVHHQHVGLEAAFGIVEHDRLLGRRFILRGHRDVIGADPNQGVLQPAARANLERFVRLVGATDGLILVDHERLEVGHLAVVDDPAGDRAPFGGLGREAQAGKDKASEPGDGGV